MEFENRWFPVARSEEVVARHVVQTQLLGQEAALWRDDSGLANAWENRCPHRGVRLSIGINTGSELQCRYHGWRYASGGGQCTFIPAHPDQKPPNVIKAKPYACAERNGFVWINLSENADPAALPALGLNAFTTMRSVFIEASAVAVAERLAAEGFAAKDFVLETQGDLGKTVLFLQPMNDGQTLVHGLVAADISGPDRDAALRTHNDRLKDIRDALEREAA
jgi:phenylpropionate dioxygenase-like ring-hydroxylating dioxygenase large terminal subunit